MEEHDRKLIDKRKTYDESGEPERIRFYDERSLTPKHQNLDAKTLTTKTTEDSVSALFKTSCDQQQTVLDCGWLVIPLEICSKERS